MTQKQIISDLGFDANYWLAKKYASKLVGLFSLINELEKLDGFKVCLNGVKGNLGLLYGLYWYEWYVWVGRGLLGGI